MSSQVRRRVLGTTIVVLITAAVIAGVKLLVNAFFHIEESRGDFIWSVVGVVAIGVVADVAAERGKRKRSHQ